MATDIAADQCASLLASGNAADALKAIQKKYDVVQGSVAGLHAACLLACLHGRDDLLRAALAAVAQMTDEEQQQVMLVRSRIHNEQQQPVDPLLSGLVPPLTPAELAANNSLADNPGTLLLAAAVGGSMACLRLLLAVQGGARLQLQHVMGAVEFLRHTASSPLRAAEACSPKGVRGAACFGSVAQGRLDMVNTLMLLDGDRQLGWYTFLALLPALTPPSLLAAAALRVPPDADHSCAVLASLVGHLCSIGNTVLLAAMGDPHSEAAELCAGLRQAGFLRRLAEMHPQVASGFNLEALLFAACGRSGCPDQAACIEAACNMLAGQEACELAAACKTWRRHAQPDQSPFIVVQKQAGSSNMRYMSSVRACSNRDNDCFVRLVECPAASQAFPQQQVAAATALIRALGSGPHAIVPDLTSAFCTSASTGDANAIRILRAACANARAMGLRCTLFEHAWKHSAFRRACSAVQYRDGALRCLDLLTAPDADGCRRERTKWDANHQSALFTACIRFCTPVLERFIAEQRHGRHAMHLQARRCVFLRRAWTRCIESNGMPAAAATVRLLLGCCGRFNTHPARDLHALPAASGFVESWQSILHSIAWSGGSMRRARSPVLLFRSCHHKKAMKS